MLRLAALAALLASCAAPKPCTRTLCAERVDGTVEYSGWKGVATLTPDSPKPPVPSDATVKIVYGSAEFSRGRARVTAAEGASFRFTVSTRAAASIEALSGEVSVTPSSGAAPVIIQPGSPYFFPLK